MSIAQQIGKVSANLENATRAGEFVALVKTLMAAGGDSMQALEMAQAARANERIITCLKTAVAAGSTTSLSALYDYRVAVGGFLGSIRNGAFDALLPSMMQLPLRTRIVLTTTAITGSRVGELSAKPISRLSLENATLEPIKASAEVTLSLELVRAASAAASALVANELRGAVAASTDLEFFSLILSGITPTASSGGGVVQVRADLTTALDALSTGASSKIFFVMSSAVAKRLSLMGDSAGNAAFAGMTPQGGTIGGVTTLVSDGLPSGYIVALDASQIAAGDDGLEIRVGRHATVQADTAPDSPVVVSTTLISLWQNDLVATRVERFFGAERLRDTGAVAAISNVNYSGNSPA
jgi:Phage capsid family